MKELSSQARKLLGAARSFDDPTDADVRRVRASVLARVGAAAGARAALSAVTVTSALAASPGAVLGATWMKVGAAILVAGGLATGTYVVVRPPSARPIPPAMIQTSEPMSVAEGIVPTVAPSTAKEPDRASTEVLPPNQAKAGRSRPSAAPPIDRARRAEGSLSDLEGEVHLLERADADLRRGDPRAALVRLAEHAAKYPAGALREEREGVHVVALCRAGRESEGKAAAERFLARAPRSALATRIRAACGAAKAD